MTELQLLDYHKEQQRIIEQRADALKGAKQVQSYADVYPDLAAKLGDNRKVAYIRGSVQLKLVCLFYDHVIVSVPPMPKETLEKRFNITWEDFVFLCDCGIVIPFIQRSEEYTAGFFNDLFTLQRSENRPYSVWARGLKLLDVYGMPDVLTNAKDYFPVDRIAKDPEIKQRWQQRSTDKKDAVIENKIREDVAVLYADLCIFGFTEEANELCQNENLTPNGIYQRLRTLSEIFTYPVLFGAGSQATYSQERLLAAEKVVFPTNGARGFHDHPGFMVFPTEECRSLLVNGVGIRNPEEIPVQDIIQYRDDTFGVRLRDALASFSSYYDWSVPNAEQYHSGELKHRAEFLKTQLLHTVHEIEPHIAGNTYDDGAKQSIFSIGPLLLGAARIVMGNSGTGPYYESVEDVCALWDLANTLNSLPTFGPFFSKAKKNYLHEAKFVSTKWSETKIKTK